MNDRQSTISGWMEHHFRHFNARETLDAARGYRNFVRDGGKMLVSLAGAMSTAELGVSLAEMIRQDKVHAISCTAANLEEDVFNLVAHNEYRVVRRYRDLSPDAELQLRNEGFNRVTDTCIPQDVMLEVGAGLLGCWQEAERQGCRADAGRENAGQKHGAKLD